MIEFVKYEELNLAIIVRSNFKHEGIKFFTHQDYSHQLGYMNGPKGYIIKSHSHKKIKRNVENTNEVLFIKKGKLKVDFYNYDNNFIVSRELNKGNNILLTLRGNDFEILEDSEIFEENQGLYSGDDDKIFFTKKEKN
tara:strand:+ start:101 stop:514 length:414 start_codon:yes stop_codon:yes gene_type:complete